MCCVLRCDVMWCDVVWRGEYLLLVPIHGAGAAGGVGGSLLRLLLVCVCV